MPLQLNMDHVVTFPNGNPVRLAGTGLYLECFHDFRIVAEDGGRAGYNAITTGYWYSLLDEGRHELFAYHYHPSGESWCTYPHLHVTTATRTVIGKSHLVTEHVSFAAFIHMLIEDPAIPVVSLRPDWSRILELKGDPDVVI